MDEEQVKAMERELEELRPLKDSTAKLQEEFTAKEKAWTEEKAKLEEEVNPNWKRTRERIRALEEAAKSKGVKLDAEGNPVDENKINREEILKEAQQKAGEAMRQQMLDARLDELLEEHSADQAKVVKAMYAKLTAGEDVTMQNIRSFVVQAESAAGIGQSSRLGKVMSAGGNGPRQVDNKTPLSDEQAESLGNLMGIKVKTDK